MRQVHSSHCVTSTGTSNPLSDCGSKVCSGAVVCEAAPCSGVQCSQGSACAADPANPTTVCDCLPCTTTIDASLSLFTKATLSPAVRHPSYGHYDGMLTRASSNSPMISGAADIQTWLVTNFSQSVFPSQACVPSEGGCTVTPECCPGLTCTCVDPTCTAQVCSAPPSCSGVQVNENCSASDCALTDGNGNSLYCVASSGGPTCESGGAMTGQDCSFAPCVDGGTFPIACTPDDAGTHFTCCNPTGGPCQAASDCCSQSCASGQCE